MVSNCALLAGVYTQTGLTLTSTLSDGTNTLLRSGHDSTPANGTSFGYYQSASATVPRAISTSVYFDNFSIQAVPEPTTLACLSIGLTGLALSVWRRRTR